MKKCIILTGLLILSLIKTEAAIQPQDSVRIYNFDLENFDMKKLNEQIDTASFDKLKDMSMAFDLKELDELEKIGENFKSDANSDSQGTTPTRTENKTFSNIAKVVFNHQYGSIIVRETNSKQVELKIQYFDADGKKAVASTSTTGNTLTVNTLDASFNVRINYIISIPKNTAMNVDLKYANIAMSNFQGAFSSNLMYSNLKADSFVNSKPVVTGKYSNVTTNEVSDIVIEASYTNVKIDKVNKMELSGKYNNYVIANVKDIVADKSGASGTFHIGSIDNISGDIKYANIIINRLMSSCAISCAYSRINIKSVSPKLAKVDIEGSYSDITLNWPSDVSASFNVDIKYGKFNIDKKHTVRYTEQTDGSNQVLRRGQIGLKKPTAAINISNAYGDVKFR